MMVNGRDFPFKGDLSVEELLKQLEYSHPRIMVSVNGEILYKDDYKIVLLNETDVVKVIHPIVGG